jgi:hypothetical protein
MAADVAIPPNENKMSDGGRGRALLGVEVWKSSQKWSGQRSAVRSIAWLDVGSPDRRDKILKSTRGMKDRRKRKDWERIILIVVTELWRERQRRVVASRSET